MKLSVGGEDDLEELRLKWEEEVVKLSVGGEEEVV